MADFDISHALSRIPYAKTLGVEPLLMGEEFTLVLPFKSENIGNPMLPALHGGAIGGFLELTAIAQLALIEPKHDFAKPIGIQIDYLRRGKSVDAYARAKIVRQGSRVVNVRVNAWQDNSSAPIAILHGHFMLANADAA